MLPRRALALLATPLALAVGCSDGDDELVVEATPAGVQSASQATLDAETATVEFSTTIDPAGMGLPAGEPFEVTGDGVIDFVNQRSEMSMDFGALADAFGGDAADMGAMFDEPMRAVQDGTTTYICFPLFEMIAGSECMSMDLSEQLGDSAGSNLFAGSGVDPQALLESLGGAEDVEDLGEEEVLGEQMQHLHGTFTLAQATENLGAEAAAEMQAAFERMGVGPEFADTPQAFDIWIDDDGRIRQMRQEIDLSALTGVEGAPIVTELRYVEFGVPVEVAVPADAVDISELEGLLGGG